MPKTTEKPQPIVMVSIKPGLVSPAQKVAGKRFWQKLIAEAKSEATK